MPIKKYPNKKKPLKPQKSLRAVATRLRGTDGKTQIPLKRKKGR